MRLEKRKIQHGLFGGILLGILIFSVWKSKYGLGGNDEAFYLTIPYRMCQGDKLFYNEWHVSQTASFLLYPLMKIYLCIFKSTDHIILNFRYIYIAFNMLVAIIAYLKMKNYGMGAAFMCCLYALYAPFNIMALSYDSMGVAFNLLCIAFLITAEEKSIDYILSGIFFAAMVLCQPLLILLFAVEFILLSVYCLMKKNKKYLQKMGYFLVGCVLLALPVLLYLFAVTGIKNVLSTVPYILQDPEHKAVTTLKTLIYNSLVLYFPQKSFHFFFLNSRRLFELLYSIYLIIWVGSLFSKNRECKRRIYLSLSMITTVFISGCYLAFAQNSYINFVLFPWFFHGITLYIYSDRQVKKVLLISYWIGCTHAIAFLGSNQYGYVFNLALLPVCLIVIMLNVYSIFRYAEGCERKIIVICSILAFMILGYARGEYVYKETPVQTLDAKCEEGPAKGIYFSKERLEEYYANVKDLKEKEITKEDNLLLLTTDTYLYLCVDSSYAQYSAWLSGINDTTYKRLSDYYELIPQKKPNKIYVLKKDEKEESVNQWCKERHADLESDEISYFIMLGHAKEE